MSRESSRVIAYYDGQCGLCHLAVVFLLKRDRTGTLYFMPTQTRTYSEFARSHGIAFSPRSVLVWDTSTATLLSGAPAVLRLLRLCSPLWKFIARMLSIVPPSVLNTAYVTIARFRHRVFKAPKDLIPNIPPSLRDRLLTDAA